MGYGGLIAELSGFFFLGSDGRLGRIDDEGTFTPLAESNDALQAAAQNLLAQYDADAVHSAIALGLVTPATPAQPWNSPTLTFTTHVIEALYPVHGVRTGTLTSFQRRNREHSIYQGMDLLLSYRRAALPGLPVYCPVLLDRGRKLESVAHIIETDPAEDVRQIPAVEIVNLLAGSVPGDPLRQTMHELCNALINTALNKSLRREAEFDVDGPARTGVPSPVAQSPARFDGGAPALDLEIPAGAPAAPPRATFGSQPPAVREVAPAFVANAPDAAMLRRYVMFSGLEDGQLHALARELRLDNAAAGETLIQRGSVDDWFYFLVDGSVSLQSDDGARMRIDSQSDPASLPLSRLVPRKFEVTAMSPVKYIRAPRDTLRRYLDVP